MPRDSSRRPARHALRHRASSPVTALTAFSALVVVSVAVSAGITPETGGERGTSAFGTPAASAERAAPTDDRWSLLAAGQEQTTPPAGPLRHDRTASPVRDGGAGTGSWREGTGRGDGGRQPASTVRPGRQAPKLYQGELPVNTIIAPARPGAVLPGGQFGWRIAPDRGGREFHNGTDVSAAAGLPVVAALDGEVTAVFWDVWGGNRVEVAHADGLKTTYNHLKDVRVQVGDRLAASEQLGSVGATGIRVTGPHLHFETWVDGRVVDPQSFDWVDGTRVIPASRSKYSLEVPVEEPADDRAVAAAPSAPAEQPARTPEKQAEKKPEQRPSTEAGTTAEPPAPERPAPAPAPAQPVELAQPPAGPAPTGDVSGPTPAEPTTPTEDAAGPRPTGPTGPAGPTEEPAEPAPIDPEPTTPSTGPTGPTPEPTAPTARPEVAPVVPDAERDTDEDGTPDVEDDNIDGDELLNHEDPDLDGDTVANEDDLDLDGDGLLNEEDPDRDGDGLSNDKDEDPWRPAPMAASQQAPDPTETTDPAENPEAAVSWPAPDVVPDSDPVPAP